MTRAPEDVVVVGAGQAGLAVAVELQRRGVVPLVLERDAVGRLWRDRYERLHLHTVRQHSALQGLAMPRRFGRFVAAADFARYLERYAEAYGVRVRAGCDVARVTELHDGDARWSVEPRAGAPISARSVVVCTGRARVPVVPQWMDAARFRGTRLLASEYRRGADHAGRRALVVGAGNSGAEIAVDLVEGGAATVDLSVRTAPSIVRRGLGPFWSAQQTGILLDRLPTRVLDLLGGMLAVMTVPDLTYYGMPRDRVGTATRVRRDGVVPLQDVGLIAAIRGGRVRVRAAVADLTVDGARFADGTTGAYDVVVAATGYGTGLESLVGTRHLDPRGLPLAAPGEAAAPGLCFAGYTVSLRGAIKDAADEAPRIAQAVVDDLCGA